MQPTEPDELTGTITRIENHGTVVLLWPSTDDGRASPIIFDHRPFAWLLDSEGCRPADLLGRSITFDGEVVAFLD